MKNYKVIEALASDIKELAVIKQRVWSENFRGIYKDELIDNFNYEEQALKFLSIINNPNIHLFVVKNDESIIGYMAYGEPMHPFLDYEQEISLLYLVKEYKRQGIGRNLFDYAKKHIKNAGYKGFIVSCNKYNESARLFYEAMGGSIIYEDEEVPDKRYVQVKYYYET